jgi:tRNA pseudouridine32 synthase / 23S rRNA pseudouridine746 synthase
MFLASFIRKIVSQSVVVAFTRSHMTRVVAEQSAAADLSPPAVALVTCQVAVPSITASQYDVTARVFLQPINENEETSKELIRKESTAAAPASAGLGTVPESVLIYQRQLRKAQHERKAGRILSSDDLQVIHVDDHLVVVIKPPGVLTVPGINSNSSLLDLVFQMYGQYMTDPVNMIVHRLDMDTSGVVVFGRTKDASKQIHALFRDRKVDKQYECLIMGHLPLDGIVASSPGDHWVEIDLPLQRDHEHPPFMRVSTPRSEDAAMKAVDDLQNHGFRKLVRKKPKQSKTLVRVVEQATWKYDDETHLPYTRLRLVPLTGRTHQLRVHCAALGYPIIGDPTYSHLGEAAPVGGLQSIDSNVINKDGMFVRTFDRCAIKLQEAWMCCHPVNVKPMCLHAAFLSFQ